MLFLLCAHFLNIFSRSSYPSGCNQSRREAYSPVQWGRQIPTSLRGIGFSQKMSSTDTVARRFYLPCQRVLLVDYAVQLKYKVELVTIESTACYCSWSLWMHNIRPVNARLTPLVMLCSQLLESGRIRN